MDCKICNFQMQEQIINNIPINYCSNCKLSITTFNTFREILLLNVENMKINDFLKQLILEKISLFFQYQFKFSYNWTKSILDKNCKNKLKMSAFYEYTYYRFLFYFCFDSDLIIFDNKKINKLLNNIKISCYFKYIIYSLKIFIINKIKKIKNLFVKYE